MNYRCTTKCCRARCTLPRRVQAYTREPRCRLCGGRLSHDPAVRRRTLAQVCYCGAHYPGGTGEPLPHRRGSLVFCKYHPVGPSEADWRALYGGRIWS